jgi:hypothetical protein
MQTSHTDNKREFGPVRAAHGRLAFSHARGII